MYNGYWIRTPKFWWWIIWIWNRVDRIVSYNLFYAKPSLIIPLMLVACWLWWGINVISLKAKFVEATWLGSSIVTLTVSGGAWSISRHLSPPGVAAPGTGPQLQGPHQDGQLLGGLLPPLQREHQQVARIQPRPIIHLSIFIYKTSASLGRRQGEADWRGRCRSGTCRRPAPAPPPASTRPRHGTSTGRRPRPRLPPASTPRRHITYRITSCVPRVKYPYTSALQDLATGEYRYLHRM